MMRYFYTLNFFMLPIEICFKEEISEELLEMLLAHLILCSLSVMHSSRLRGKREKVDPSGWDGKMVFYWYAYPDVCYC
jgi:hypothetical protein